MDHSFGEPGSDYRRLVEETQALIGGQLRLNCLRPVARAKAVSDAADHFLAEQAERLRYRGVNSFRSCSLSAGLVRWQSKPASRDR